MEILFGLLLVLLKSKISFCLVHIQDVMTVSTPRHRAVHRFSVLSRLSITDTPRNCRNIWVFLQMTGLRLGLEVWGVHSEEDWWEYGPLRCSCAVTSSSDTQPFSLANCGLLVRYSVIQEIVKASTCVFWSFLCSKMGWLVRWRKLKNMTLTALPALFRWLWVCWSRCLIVSSTPTPWPWRCLFAYSSG